MRGRSTNQFESLATMLDKLVHGRAPEALQGPQDWREWGICQTHGRYQINCRDEHGTLRYHAGGCQTCASQAEARRLLGRAEVGPRFLDCSFDNYRVENAGQRAALDRCRAYALQFEAHHQAGRSLILRGNPGTGKNHLAAAIVLHVLQHGYTALQATAFEMIARIKETWGKGGEEQRAERELDVIRRFSKVDLLVIDEVGRQFGKEADHILLFHVLDGRYRNGLPTIVISNRPTEEIKHYLTPAGYDRLRGGRLVNFDWESARGIEV